MPTSLDPDKGTTTLGHNGFGELTSSLDAQGRTSKLFYDPLGRRTRREEKASVTSSVEVTTWAWDTALMGVSGQLALGALAEVESPEGTASRSTYDALGRLHTTVRSIDGELFGTTATYDEFSRVATVVYHGAHVL